MLETEKLTIRFGGHVAVDAVSCIFRRGTLTAIVGPNGAGKTTYFNLISGQLKATAGKVRLNGVDITHDSASARTHRGLGRAFQLTQLFPGLSVLENVRLAVQSRRREGLRLWSVWLDQKQTLSRARELVEQVQLGPRADALASSLPHGDQRKLEVAMLMALEPSVYMFDEPTAGMSADDVPVVLDLIRALKAGADKTILLVEHKMDVVRELADRIVVLHNGQLVADGEPAAVIASPIVQQAYLGGSPEADAPPVVYDSAPTRTVPVVRNVRAMAEPLLELRGVHTHIGAYHILHGVDLAVPAGQVTMLLGRNGAGKTTTLRTIMGLWAASKGSLRFKGETIGGREGDAVTSRSLQLGTPQIARRGIAYVPENMGIFGDLTVQENMVLAARSARRASELDTQRLDWIFGLFPALKKFWLYPAGKLSGGQKQMLAVARAIVEPRELLLVDEPSKGLAPAIVLNLIEAFRQLKAQRTTVLLVEQNVAMAKALGDHVAVMDNGRVVHAGPMAELAADEAMQRRLLGLSLGAHG